MTRKPKVLNDLREAIPETGWSLRATYDNGRHREPCDTCGKHLRYVCVLSHPTHVGRVHVGRECFKRLTGQSFEAEIERARCEAMQDGDTERARTFYDFERWEERLRHADEMLERKLADIAPKTEALERQAAELARERALLDKQQKEWNTKKVGDVAALEYMATKHVEMAEKLGKYVPVNEGARRRADAAAKEILEAMELEEITNPSEIMSRWRPIGAGRHKGWKLIGYEDVVLWDNQDGYRLQHTRRGDGVVTRGPTIPKVAKHLAMYRGLKWADSLEWNT